MRQIQTRHDATLPPPGPLPDISPDIARVARGDEPRLTVRQQQEILALVAELASREKEALRLYRPWPVQEAFHASRAGIRLARGSNRGGKTLSASVELARAVTGQDPHGKYPAKGRAISVGKDLLHCSKVTFRKLFRPGAFLIIRDERTGEWRPYVPEWDEARKGEAEEAPPLISQRFYNPKEISWENKREEIARSVRFKTGWELTFFSGEGEPPQGWDLDLIHFDEEIPHPRWYPEMVPRLVDKGGYFFWSFTPQAGTVVAYELFERAMEEKGTENPRVEDFLMTIADNPYLSEASKQQFYKDLSFDEEELKVRYFGDFALKGLRVYPEFMKTGPHRVEPFAIPDDWTIYIAMDPGRRVAAALILAVPPPNDPKHDRPVVFAEVYVKQSTAARFADELKRVLGERQVQDWLIDHMHGRKTQESGENIEELYAREFRRAGLDRNGFKGFIWASSDVAAGKIAAKGTLQIRDGAPAWYFVTSSLHWFCWEIERYIDKRITRGGHVVDDISRSNLHNHLMDCWRYLALHDCKYVKPPRPKARKNWVMEALERKRNKRNEEAGWGSSIRLA